MRGRPLEASGYGAGRLTARVTPHTAPLASAQAEIRPAEDAGWSGVLYVAPSYRPESPAPLMVALHGATGHGERMLNRWREVADRAGLVVLAPDSLERTWDVLVGGYGRDVARIDRALLDVFSRVNVHRAPLLIEGFSDGASYALSLGLANGDLFSHILAHSPGFCMPPSFAGTPRIFISHGTEDKVLPISHTSRLLAPQLDMAGYDVKYEEFEGGHQLTEEMMVRSLEWAGIRVAPGN